MGIEMGLKSGRHVLGFDCFIGQWEGTRIPATDWGEMLGSGLVCLINLSFHLLLI